MWLNILRNRWVDVEATRENSIRVHVIDFVDGRIVARLQVDESKRNFRVKAKFWESAYKPIGLVLPCSRTTLLSSESKAGIAVWNRLRASRFGEAVALIDVP